MKEIRFNCPECESNLIVEEEGAGMEVDCPACGAGIRIPEISGHEAAESASDELNVLSTKELEELTRRILYEVGKAGGLGGEMASQLKDAGSGRRDIVFDCPYCSGHLIVSEEGAGLKIDCPICSKPLTIPDLVGDGLGALASDLVAQASEPADTKGQPFVPSGTQMAVSSVNPRLRGRRDFYKPPSFFEEGDESGDANQRSRSRRQKGALKPRVDPSRMPSQNISAKAKAKAAEDFPTTRIPIERSSEGAKPKRRRRLSNAARRKIVYALWISGFLVAFSSLVLLIWEIFTLPPEEAAGEAAPPAEHSLGEQDSLLSIPEHSTAQGEGFLPVSIDLIEQREVLQRIRDYCSRKDWRDRLDLVRNREETEPLMQDYYSENPDLPIHIDKIEFQQAGVWEKKLFALVSVVTKETFEDLFFVAEKTEGGYKVDWENLMEYNPTSWAEYKSIKPQNPVVFRALLAVGDYYNYDFADSSKYQCYEIYSRSQGKIGLYGYASRDSEMEEKLLELVTGDTPITCMVALRFPDSSNSENQVEIVEFLRAGWLVP